MATEIERKFLLTDDSWRSAVSKSTRICQGYLSNSKKSSVRVRTSGDKANLNIKSAALGVTRSEYEYVVPLDDAEQMLESLCSGPLIEKTRHIVEYEGHHWEIDVFEGDNAGLEVAEIELDDPDETFARPDWLGDEVSDDTRYYNVCLATHPYKDW